MSTHPSISAYFRSNELRELEDENGTLKTLLALFARTTSAPGDAKVERRGGWALIELAHRIGRRERDVTVIKGVTIQHDLADLADTTIYLLRDGARFVLVFSSGFPAAAGRSALCSHYKMNILP